MINKYIKLSTVTAIGLLLSLTACSGGGGSSSNANTISFSGTAVDGYISGATACLDININASCDSDEPTTTTDSDGSFSFSDVEVDDGLLVPVIVFGGTDTATDKPFSGELKNIINTTDVLNETSLNVTPLTDLIASSYMNSDDKSSSDLAQAKEDIATAFGVSIDKVELDPMQDKELFAKAQEIQQTKELILASALKDANIDPQSDEAKALANDISLSIALSIGDNNSQLDTLSVMNKLESINTDVTIPDNEKTFIASKMLEVKNSLDALVADATVSIETLSQEQASLEENIAVATQNIEDATDNSNTILEITTIAQVPEETVWNVTTVNNYSYISVNHTMLKIYNVSDKSNPEEVGSYGGFGNIYNITVKDDFTYISDTDTGLVILDTKDKTNPKILSTYKTDFQVYNVTVDSNYAYVTNNDNALLILDITDKTAPTLTGFFDGGLNYSKDVYVEGNYAYIVGAHGDHLRILDISDRTKPNQIGICNIPVHAQDIVIDGNYAYVTSDTYGFSVIDITDKKNPVKKGFWDTQEAAMGMAIYGNYALIANSDSFVILDITDKTTPTFLTSFSNGSIKVSVSQNYAYIAGNDGLTIVELLTKFQ